MKNRLNIILLSRLVRARFGCHFHSRIIHTQSIASTKDKCSLITTPIFYVNAPPHLGHVYTATIADAITRYRHLREDPVLLSTGTDEHGLKIQQSAASSAVTPQQFCDTNSSQFQSLFDSYGIGYNKFIRTTDKLHVSNTQHFYKSLVERGQVYKGEYSGWYCVSDESFLTESQVKELKLPNGQLIKVSSESNNPVEWSTEINYKFKLSQYQSDLLYWLQDEDRIKPKRFLLDLRKMLSNEQIDLSITRPKDRVSWGIQVPNDADHTVYVWVDALVNYLTAAGYPSNHMQWPPQVQVLGKDILKFHGIYWPALLMAAGLEPPKQLLVHSHWTVDGIKMSKSLGNVVCPKQVINTLTAEGVRYCLLRQGTPHSDGSWREAEAIELVNTELADTLGNLVYRCTGKALNRDQVFPAIQPEFMNSSLVVKELCHLLDTLRDDVAKCYDEYNFYQGIDCIMRVVRCANLMIQEEKPWELKANPDRQNSIVHMALSTGHAAAILLQPIVPCYSSRLLDTLAVPFDSRLWRHASAYPCVEHKATPLGERKAPFKKIKL